MKKGLYKLLNNLTLNGFAEVGGYTVRKFRNGQGFVKFTLEAADYVSGELNIEDAVQWITDAN